MQNIVVVVDRCIPNSIGSLPSGHTSKLVVLVLYVIADTFVLPLDNSVGVIAPS